MSNIETEAEDNNNKKYSKTIGVFGEQDNENAVVVHGKLDPATGAYSEVAIRPKTESGTTHIFDSKTRPMGGEKDQDEKNVRFQFLVNEMAKKIRAEKYGRNSLTYQVTPNDETDILADLNPTEERAVIAAARQKIELEQKEQEQEREQRQIDAHRRLTRSREFCDYCHEKLGWAPDSMSRHLKTCTLYQNMCCKRQKIQNFMITT